MDRRADRQFQVSGPRFPQLPLHHIEQMQLQSSGESGEDGFFVSHTHSVPSYDTFLTIGHNLIGTDGTLSQNITMIAIDPYGNSCEE